jgi:hypothetical protein
VAAISSTEVAGRTASVLKIIGLQNYQSQYQVVLLGVIAATLMLLKTFFSLFLNKRIIFFLSRRGAVISGNLTSSLFKKSFTDIKFQGDQKLIYSLTSGVDKIAVGVIGTSVALIADFALLLILLTGLIFVNPLMTFILLFSLCSVATVLYLSIKNKNKKLAILSANYSITSSSKIYDAIGNYRELLLRGKRQYFADGIKEVRINQAEATATANYLTNINKYILEVSVLLITLLIAGIQFMLSGDQQSIEIKTSNWSEYCQILQEKFSLEEI